MAEPILSESNDLVIYTKGDPQPIELPDDVVLGEAVDYLDALEYSSVANQVRKCTDDTESRPIGACRSSGGQASGALPSIARGFAHKVTIGALSAAVSPGDRVRMISGTTCLKVAPVSYAWQANTYGEALESGVAGESIWVYVDPLITV